jgi:hypothetical protein
MNGSNSPHQLDADDVTLTLVPESSSLALMGVGGVAVLAFARVRRRAVVA